MLVRRRVLILGLLALPLFGQELVRDVRVAINSGDLPAAIRAVQQYRQSSGVTPEYLEGLSWLGRAELANKNLDAAGRYALDTRQQALELLKTRALDAEPRLPIALGASIEVQAHVMAQRNALSDSVAFLNQEIARWKDTSIATRLHKNLNLLTLEGKQAPALEMARFLGTKPQPLTAMSGHPLLLYFWAHWCGDCAIQAPILARLQKEHPELRVIGPTQLYGYARAGEDATPQQELAWIDRVRRERYSSLRNMPVPVSATNFINYGSSTTPTLVLVDRQGIVKLYHPGRMTYEELKPRIAALVAK